MAMRFSKRATLPLNDVFIAATCCAKGATATPAAETGPWMTSPPPACTLAGGVSNRTAAPLISCSEKYDAAQRRNGALACGANNSVGLTWGWRRRGVDNHTELGYVPFEAA